MKSILIFSPPGWSVFVPNCSGPMLAGFLSAKNIRADVLDLNSLHLKKLLSENISFNVTKNNLQNWNRFALNNHIEEVDLASYYGKSELELTLFETFSIPESEYGELIRCELSERYKYLESFDVFGISVTLTRQIYPALIISKILKTHFPQKTIVVGGSAISSFWDQIVNTNQFFDFFDLAIRGDGSIPLQEILEGKNVEKIHSASYRKGNRIFINNLSQIPDDLYFYPPLYKTEYLKNYPKPLVLGIPSNIGCYHNKCAFCTYPSAKKYKYRFWGEDALVNTMEKLQDNAGVDSFYFTGAGLLPAHFKRVAELINKRGLKVNWSSESLATKIDLETIHEMKESGCNQLDFGLESASKPIRDFLNKGIKIENLRFTLENIREIGFNGTTVNLILETPITNKNDFEETLSFLKEYEDIIFCSYQFNLEIQLSSDYYQTYHNYSEEVIRTRPDTLVKLFPYNSVDQDLLKFWEKEFNKLSFGGLYTRDKRIDGGLIDIALCLSNGSKKELNNIKYILKDMKNINTEIPHNSIDEKRFL